MKKSIFWVLAFVCPFLVFGQTPTEKLTQALEQSFHNSTIPGVAVAIVNKDKILYQHAMGFADIANKTPYTQHTIHNIGSTSKTFIGVALMQLVEAGKLDLDVDINQYLPFQVQHPYHPNTSITLRQLATHTASIRDRTFNYDLQAYVSNDNTRGNRKGLPLIYKIQFKRMLKSEQVSLGEFLTRTLSKEGQWYRKKNFFKHAPGTVEEYTNIGAALAGYIIEVVTGEKYGDYVKNNILQPLNMDASGWTMEDVDSSRFAKRYIGDRVVPDYELITYPDGGLISSSADLSTYLMTMMQGYYGENNFLSAAAFQTMMQNQYKIAPLSKVAAALKSQRGIFWDIFGEDKDGDIGHSGSDPGITTFMYFDPVEGIGCILNTNVDGHAHHAEYVELWKLLIEHKEAFQNKK